MTEREQRLDFILTHIRNHHVGWRNAVPMRKLAAAAGLTPSLLKADRHNEKAGYIPELRKRGYPILSCNKGYYYPRPKSDPEGREKDFAKCKSRLRGHALGELFAQRETERAVRYAEELKLFDV